MRPRLIIGVVALLAAALAAPAAHAATEVRQVRVPVSASPTTPPGTMALDFAFKNKRANKRKFTPRQLTRIAFSEAPLQCFNSAGTGITRLLLTTTLQTTVKVTKAAQPSGKKPKPNRFAFRFAYSFQAFTGTLRGTIDRSNHGPGACGPRAPSRSPTWKRTRNTGIAPRTASTNGAVCPSVVCFNSRLRCRR